MIILRNKLYSWADKILAEKEGISINEVRKNRKLHHYDKDSANVNHLINLRDRQLKKDLLSSQGTSQKINGYASNGVKDLNKKFLGEFKKAKVDVSGQRISPKSMVTKAYYGKFKKSVGAEVERKMYEDFAESELNRIRKKEAQAEKRAAKRVAEETAKRKVEETAKKKGLIHLVKSHPIPTIIGGTALAGGGIYLYHRHKKKKSEKQDKE